MARPNNPNERKYRMPDEYSRMLFHKVFEKHGLSLYRYKGTQRRTSFCDGDVVVQKRAFAEFMTYEVRLQRALERATEQLWERWEKA